MLGGNEVNVAIDAARREDHVLARNHFGTRAYNKLRVYPGHRVGIARFAHLHNATIFNANIPFDDAPVIKNQRVGDDQIKRALSLSIAGGTAALAHSIADDFAAAKGNFVAIDGEVGRDGGRQVQRDLHVAGA